MTSKTTYGSMLSTFIPSLTAVPIAPPPPPPPHGTIQNTLLQQHQLPSL